MHTQWLGQGDPPSKSGGISVLSTGASLIVSFIIFGLKLF